MNSLRKYFLNKPLKLVNKLYTRAGGNAVASITKEENNNKSNDKENNNSTKLKAELLKSVGYFEKISKHRAILPIYDLLPAFPINCWIAPNATLSKFNFISNLNSWRSCIRTI